MNRWLLLISVMSLWGLVSCQDDPAGTSSHSHDDQGGHEHAHEGHDHAHEGHDHPHDGDGHAHETAHGQTAGTRHTGVIEEVLHATSYTYLRIKEDGGDIWVALPKQELPVGQTVSFAGGLEMNNFASPDLKRTFERVYFISSVSMDGDEPAVKPHGRPKVEVVDVSVDPAEGGISLATLFANPQTYAGQSVTIRGQVTKVNRAIMNKNWIHLQDGTKNASGPYDLTLTTTDQAEVGETVTFTGKIALNKDFGYGYAYDVIMEESKRIE